MPNGAPNIKAKFNDRSDPSFEIENQCVCFKRTCSKCNSRFEPTDTKCKFCGEVRTRCKNRAMDGEEVCRVHASGKAYSLYNKLASTLTDSVLEEFIEADDRDLEQEYALAKVALSGTLDNQNISSEKLMSMVKEFFIIAEKKKNIEKGQVLNISWNDDLANSLRLRVRRLIKTFTELLDKYIEDPETKKNMLKELKERTQMVGNLITSPPSTEDYKD